MKEFLSRRQFLTASVSTASAFGLAGCLSNNGDGRPPAPSGDKGVSSLPRPYLGVSEDEAAVTVEIFEDYMCPHCADFNKNVLPEIKRQYVGSEPVRLEFYDYPLPVSDRWSWRVAMAARAVQDLTSIESFWNFHSTIFNYQNQMSDQVIQDTASAQQVGADETDVIQRTNDNVYQPVVVSDKERGDNLGVTGTPSVFVNGGQVSRPTRQDVIAAIENQLNPSG